jgi:hypothetical protein
MLGMNSGDTAFILFVMTLATALLHETRRAMHKADQARYQMIQARSNEAVTRMTVPNESDHE